jgi:hypothetical protein
MREDHRATCACSLIAELTLSGVEATMEDHLFLPTVSTPTQPLLALRSPPMHAHVHVDPLCQSYRLSPSRRDLSHSAVNIVLPPTGPPHRPDSWGTLLAPPHPLESLVAQALLGGSKTLYDPASKGLRHGGNPLRCRKTLREAHWIARFEDRGVNSDPRAHRYQY